MYSVEVGVKFREGGEEEVTLCTGESFLPEMRLKGRVALIGDSY